MTNGAIASPTSEIARLINEVLKDGNGLAEESTGKIVQELAKLFSVKLDEVAILELSTDGKVLRFLHPFKLKQMGSIPLSTTNSLAVRTVRAKRPEMINNFPAQKHPTIFEAVGLDPIKKELEPIQKIISAPLLLDSKPVGVIQISRKGKSLKTAGDDFTISDLTSLMTTAAMLAKCFKK